MKEELSRLLYNYFINDKIADKDFIGEVVSIFVKEKNLNDYLFYGDVKKSYGTNKTVAAYDPITKQMIVYTDGIINLLKSNEKYHHLFKKNEELLFINSLIMQQILHELEHVNQRKIVAEENNIEATILKMCLRELNRDKKTNEQKEQEYLNYKKYYSISPEERMAQIKSLQNIRVILKNTNIVSDITDFMGTSLLETSLNGYENNCPIIDYLKKINKEKLLEQFSWYDKHDSLCLKKSKESFKLNDRLLYGLPIDIKEKNIIEDNIICSKKYIKL
ncbi:MAG: hypothetical protein J6B64_01200 [Bacilli bacterium]|nr:hypothetical protein [Bacilli bacterium]MBP3920037.1 hypothetical protein [Bacilli bacterium]